MSEQPTNAEFKAVRIRWESMHGLAKVGQTKDGYLVCLFVGAGAPLSRKSATWSATVHQGTRLVLSSHGTKFGSTRAKEAAMWTVRDSIARDRKKQATDLR